MHVDPRDLASTYAAMTESQLLETARIYDTLTEPAQAALRTEFAARNLEPPLIEDASEPVEPDYVTVQRYRDLSEAIVARTLLESAGIDVYLRDENLVRLDWQLSNFIGGLRLQVHRNDEQAALDLLAEPIAPTIPLPGQPDFIQPQCPACGSIDITDQGRSRAAAFAGLYIAALPLPTGPRSWLCESCGTRWENSDEQ